MRQGRLLSLCVALLACAGLAQPQRAHAATRTPMRAGPAKALVRLIGQDALDQPLLPQPGDIWADVLPKRPAVSSPPSPVSTRRAEPRAGDPTVPHPVARAREQPTVRGAGIQANEAGHEAAATGGESAPRQVAATHSAVRERVTPPVRDDAVRAQARVDTGGQATVQLAASASAAGAMAAWRQIRQDAPGLTDGHNPAISSAEVNGREVWRLRAGGFADVTAARAFCSGIRAAKGDCWVVPASAVR